jgi:hypothetical protein
MEDDVKIEHKASIELFLQSQVPTHKAAISQQLPFHLTINGRSIYSLATSFVPRYSCSSL